jgi:hypothetical protein
MDPTRFDVLFRLLATVPSRRTALGGLAALVSGLLAPVKEAAARPRVCRPAGALCFPDRGLHCCRGECHNGRCPRHKRCRPGQRQCGGRCISRKRCCTNANCRTRETGRVCKAGKCVPAAGTCQSRRDCPGGDQPNTTVECRRGRCRLTRQFTTPGTHSSPCPGPELSRSWPSVALAAQVAQAATPAGLAARVALGEAARRWWPDSRSPRTRC